MTDIYEFLDKNDIAYERHDHPAVFTVEDVHRLVPPLPAAKTKNLFFRDKKGKRHFLIIVEGDKRLDIKGLPAALDADRISFGSPDRLMQHLGVEPGSVTLFALVNDSDRNVELVIDQSLWESEAFQFHPLVNTATLVVTRDNVEKFLKETGHCPKIIDVPGK